MIKRIERFRTGNVGDEVFEIDVEQFMKREKELPTDLWILISFSFAFILPIPDCVSDLIVQHEEQS